MLKFQSFKVSDHDKVNKFLDTHVPYSTAEQGGIMLHSGYIVIKYDDGRKDDQREVFQLLNKRTEENKAKLLSIQIEIRLTNIQINEIKPNGYKGTEDIGALTAMYREEGYKGSEANTMAENLNHFRQANFISMKEVERLQHTIKVTEEMAAESLKEIRNK